MRGEEDAEKPQQQGGTAAAGAQPTTDETKLAATTTTGGGTAAKEQTTGVTKGIVLVSVTLSLLQHIFSATPESTLFLQASEGSAARAATSMSACTGISGLMGLFVNQGGGKLSDCLGRKGLFLVGPIVNLGVAMVYHSTRHLPALIVARSLKLMVTSFSGSVMCLATLMDICTGQELAEMNGKLGGAIGLGVLLGQAVMTRPRLNHDPLTGVKLMAIAAALQGLLVSGGLAETLRPEKRISMAEFRSSLSSINPLSFLKLYTGKGYSWALRMFATIHAFQCCSEATSTRDILLIYCRENLKHSNGSKWSKEFMAGYFALWGACASFSGMFLSPFLLKRMSSLGFTTVANLGVTLGHVFGYGFQEQTRNMLWALPLLLPGINGNNAVGIKALAGGLAIKHGMGKGEFSGWLSNMRAITTGLAAVGSGLWYARAQDNRLGKLPVKSVWWLIAFFGGLLPQLLCWTALSKRDFIL